MADMQELIARLEAAEVGSRELDVAIWAASNGYELVRFDGAGWLYKMHADDIQRHERTGYISSYSTSLDAALALAERVLPGWVYQIDVQSDLSWVLAAPDWWAPALAQGPEACGGQASVAKTPALALCIAILKAKAQGEGG